MTSEKPREPTQAPDRADHTIFPDWDEMMEEMHHADDGYEDEEPSPRRARRWPLLILVLLFVMLFVMQGLNGRRAPEDSIRENDKPAEAPVEAPVR